MGVPCALIFAILSASSAAAGICVGESAYLRAICLSIVLSGAFLFLSKVLIQSCSRICAEGRGISISTASSKTSHIQGTVSYMAMNTVISLKYL